MAGLANACEHLLVLALEVLELSEVCLLLLGEVEEGGLVLLARVACVAEVVEEVFQLDFEAVHLLCTIHVRVSIEPSSGGFSFVKGFRPASGTALLVDSLL